MPRSSSCPTKQLRWLAIFSTAFPSPSTSWSLGIQVFDGDQSVVLDQSVFRDVAEIALLVGNVRVQASDCLARLLPRRLRRLWMPHLPLCSTQHTLGQAEVARDWLLPDRYRSPGTPSVRDRCRLLRCALAVAPCRLARCRSRHTSGQTHAWAVTGVLSVVSEDSRRCHLINDRPHFGGLATSV